MQSYPMSLNPIEISKQIDFLGKPIVSVFFIDHILRISDFMISTLNFLI